MKDPGTTQPFRGPAGELLPGSIAEVAYLRLGGLEQWVMIRGESLANPPLILLQGGPGLSETHFFRYFNAPLEKAFTIVYWDQRGSGKSFAAPFRILLGAPELSILELPKLMRGFRFPSSGSRNRGTSSSWMSRPGSMPR